MREMPRQINMKKFLTLWAPRPEKVPERVRRAALLYGEMAETAAREMLPTAVELRLIAHVLAVAADDLEAAFAARAG